MKVFVVMLRIDYEGECLIGVAASRAAAECVARRYAEEQGGWTVVDDELAWARYGDRDIYFVEKTVEEA